jgi:hypothetical protein
MPNRALVYFLYLIVVIATTSKTDFRRHLILLTKMDKTLTFSKNTLLFSEMIGLFMETPMLVFFKNNLTETNLLRRLTLKIEVTFRGGC